MEAQAATAPPSAAFYVGASAIHGQGLFAGRDFEEGELIGYVQGRTTQEDGPYVLWINDMTIGVNVDNEMRFINHADEANACYYEDLTVMALRYIRAGEEITHNYGEEWKLEMGVTLQDEGPGPRNV